MIRTHAWEQRLREDHRRVLILDDDPTGTQTVSDVEVILRPSLASYRRFFAGSERAAYILTNSRALPVEQAVSLIESIREEAELAAAESATGIAFVLRGDSTLRGHISAEMDALASSDSVGLFVPAFPEGGRVTVDGVHYLEDGESRIPVARTEFARDPVFGYRSEKLVDWIAEVGEGRSGIPVCLQQLRDLGPEAVTGALLNAPPGSVVLPDAETRTDLETIAWGLLDAESQGRHVVVRSGSTFAAIRADLRAASVQTVSKNAQGRVLVVCGSHTEASTRQLEKLVSRPSPPVTVPTDRLLSEGAGSVVPALARQLAHGLKHERFAILATERVRRSEHGDLAVGEKVMEAVTATVSEVADACDAVVSKGGITSAQVATEGLSAVSARVRGQLEPGVSLWDLNLPDGRHLPYAVIPGNVGHDGTMVNIAAQFGIERLKEAPYDGGQGGSGTASQFRFEPIEQKPLIVEITSRLMDYLLSGAIKPGDKLPAERQLSETLDVPRSALREGLKALSLLGLIDTRRGDGTYLKKADSPLLPQVIEWGLLLGESRTMDLMETRQEIEPVIAKLAAIRRNEEALEKLQQLLKKMERSSADPEGFVEADVAFHLALAEASGNVVLRDILSGIQALLHTWITTVIQSANNTETSYLEHVPIVEAVERGDAEGTRNAMERHMEGASSRLNRALAEADNTPNSGASQDGT